jgi:DNA-binding MarR family transcriptional regulator
MRQALTYKQLDVLDFILTYFEKHNCAPSQAEIAVGAEIRQGNVGKYLEALHKKRHIVFTNFLARGIELVPYTQQELDEMDAMEELCKKKMQAKLEKEAGSNS